MPVALTNAHLFYNLDYSEQIVSHLAKRSARGELAIIGGDTNNPKPALAPGETIVTNFTSINGQMTVKHGPTSEQVKCYDNFFIAPPKGRKAIITISEENQFKLQTDGTIKVELSEVRPAKRYTTLIGAPTKDTTQQYLKRYL